MLFRNTYPEPRHRYTPKHRAEKEYVPTHRKETSHRRETWHDRNKKHYGVIGSVALMLTAIGLVPAAYPKNSSDIDMDFQVSPRTEAVNRFVDEYIEGGSQCLKGKRFDPTLIIEIDEKVPAVPVYENGILSLTPFGESEILYLKGFDEPDQPLQPRDLADAKILVQNNCDF